MYAYNAEFSESRANSGESLTIEPDRRVFIGVIRTENLCRPEISCRGLPMP
jgi:hypothetical protein